MESVKEKICLDALSAILDVHVDNACYSLHGPKESAVCLEATKNGWEVYDKERNARDDCKLYDNIVEACLEMISRLFKQTEVQSYKNHFLNSIIGMQHSA